MGNYTLTLNEGGSDTFGLALGTDQGPLKLEGSGTVTHSGAQFDGKAWVDKSSTEDTRAALQGLLAAIGPIAKDGSVIMKIR